MDTSIRKEESQLLKGWAVFLMVSGHLLTVRWINNDIQLMDIRVFDETLTGVLINLLNCCVHIFAFLTGYIWNVSFTKKSKLNRIIDIYGKYWFSLLVVVPFFFMLNDIEIESINWFCEMIGVNVQMSRFCWYIPFFALAILTYPILRRILRGGEKQNPYFLIILIVAVGFAMRVVGRVLFKAEVIDEIGLDLCSRYFSTMPSLLIGTIVNEYGLFDVWNKRVKQREIVAIILISLFVVINFGVIYVLDISSNWDCVTIVFYMWAAVTIIKLLKKDSVFYKIFNLLGKHSLYIWLIHCIFFLPQVQKITYILRVPVLVIIMVLLLSLLISIGMSSIEEKVRFLFRRKVKNA